jgi:hypothetical protein
MRTTSHDYAVRYAWIDAAGRERRARSVASGTTRELAEERFQRQNPHVRVVASLRLSGDPDFRATLAKLTKTTTATRKGIAA